MKQGNTLYNYPSLFILRLYILQKPDFLSRFNSRNSFYKNISKKYQNRNLKYYTMLHCLLQRWKHGIIFYCTLEYRESKEILNVFYSYPIKYVLRNGHSVCVNSLGIPVTKALLPCKRCSCWLSLNFWDYYHQKLNWYTWTKQSKVFYSTKVNLNFLNSLIE